LNNGGRLVPIGYILGTSCFIGRGEPNGAPKGLPYGELVVALRCQGEGYDPLLTP